ncbi:MAG TPA: TonB-dependent receptor [Dokdonella sp.]|uniref:TonB-dependent receptor n=1 Tax=Dokdonella sp. TaxID=2291710 RepID=UPI002CD24D73|nr:TonB-dependent receptor [Dokdonella sp.]HUD40373.1 TonB-dependent receptor [Dokdonella sp.]
MKGLACLIALLLLWAGPPARADAAAGVDYRIERGPLGEVLNAWATQSGVQLLYPPQIVARRTSAGLSGRLTPQQALERLLRATGIEATAVGGGTFVLRRAAPVRAERPAKPAPPSAVDEHAQLPQVDVHGNRLGRIVTATSTPTTTITREQIQASGYLTLFDLLRSQPGVQVTRQPEAMSGDSAGLFRAGSSGAASVALRRLGAHATLLLLDGRRLTDYGLAGGDGGIADIGSIPLAMIERIDIIRDGAGTRYGAAAMAGVIDITLRKRLDGGEITTLQGLSSRGDAGHRQLSGALGEHFANGADLLLMVDAVDADPLLGDRRDWYTLDRRSEGLRDARSVFSFPGNFSDDFGLENLRARAGCAAQDLDKDGRCLADTTRVTTLRTGKNSRSLLGHVRMPLTGPWDAYADLRLARVDHRQQSAPSAGVIVNPAAAGLPGGDYLYYGFWDIGPIRQRTRSEVARAQFGLERKGHTWTFDNIVGVEHSRVEERITGLVNRDRFLDLTNENHYGFNLPVVDPQLALALAPPLDNRARTRVLDVASTVSGHVGGWSSGEISIDAGAQWRRETLHQAPDASLSSDDLLIGRLEGRYDATRTTGSGYARAGVPLPGGMQVDLGWRVERDSHFGSRTSPALALLWTPLPSVLLRAGVTRGWRTPAPLEQRPPFVEQGSYEYVAVPEALLPCALSASSGTQIYCLLEQRSGYNRNLRPETSRGINAGLIWEPAERFSIGLDLYQLRRSDEIGDIPLSYALQHPAAFPDALVRDEAGRLEAVNLFRVNLGRTTTRGVDLDLRWTSAPTRYGTFGFDIAANWLDELSVRPMPDAPEYERAGYAGQPRLTAIGALRWSRNAWSSTLLLRHTGHYRYRQYDADTLDCPDYRAAVHKCSTPGFTLVNASVAYTGWRDWRLSLGVANLFDHTPKNYDEASGGYNPRFDDPVGRYFWLGATRRF